MTNTTSFAELDTFITDLNGIPRGKRIPAAQADNIIRNGFKMPRSAVGLDIWGDDVPGHGLVFETGDNDGLCLPVQATPLPIPWLQGGHQQLLAMMQHPDGSPFPADPRQILKRVAKRYTAQGLTPVVATELEFYLVPEAAFNQTTPLSPQYGMDCPAAYSIDCIDQQRAILEDIRRACQVQNIPAEAITSELGHGQFEINLNHVADPLAAADYALLFKRLVKGVARQHGQRATFMAKPFAERSGNGMHLHFSLLDQNGSNVFANGSPQGSPLLQHAVAGLLEAMPASMLVFAPHLNSYRRLLPGSHAPVTANWGYENRTVAVRIPDSPEAARRIEHRVAGADANPYLVIAVVLAAALQGIQQLNWPAAPLTGDAYSTADPGPALPAHWREALQAFTDSDLPGILLGDLFVQVFTAVKQQEYDKLMAHITEIEYQTYW